MKKPSWYGKIEKTLLPVQIVVNMGLILIAIISLTFVFSKEPIKKTAWFVYMISP
jgi:hypothetical protein